MSRAPNYEFQEWWNKHRDFLDNSDSSSAFLSVEIRSPTSDQPVDKGRTHTRNARQLSWLCLLKFQQVASSLAWITNAFVLLLRTANRRNATPDSDSASSRLYRIIKVFLILVILLLCFELVTYFKGWHFSPPSVESAEMMVERAYAKWLEIRANYLAPPLQTLANVCIVLFLILSVYRVVLVLGCFWIKFRRLKPVAAMEYSSGVARDVEDRENAEDYPMVLVQIPMCNEREVYKDYIHVRARRGQATDSYSLAERVRREKISERMKFLQDLVPGCNKVTGKALMLDEIINYVQSLQRQVECLSMKLASVNTTRLDFNMDTLSSKDVFQSNNTLPNPIFPLGSSASAFLNPHPQQNPPLHSNISSGTATFCEDDLQSIVQMGFGRISSKETSFQSHSLHGTSQVPHMKVEL